MQLTISYSQYRNTSPQRLVAGTRVPVKIVAVVGYGNDWAAYIGPSEWTDQRVSEEGDKISEDAAKNLFPAMAQAFGYRS